MTETGVAVGGKEDENVIAIAVKLTLIKHTRERNDAGKPFGPLGSLPKLKLGYGYAIWAARV